MLDVHVTERSHDTLSLSELHGFWNDFRITLKLMDLFTERGNTKGLITKHEAEEQGCLRMEKIVKKIVPILVREISPWLGGLSTFK